MLFLSTPKQDIQAQSGAVELRLDRSNRIDIESVKNFIQISKSPVMLTLRKKSQGGDFRGSEEERLALIKQLLALKPPFFDLECDIKSDFLHEMIQTHPKTKFVLSYHNFQNIPIDLDAIYHSMQMYPAFSYKIAVMVHSTNDALKMLLFAKKHPQTSVICMGEKGQFARILGPVAGNLIDYASQSVAEQTGPSQLSFSELMDIYRYPSLNKETAIYGLIGDPIAQSPGHLYHNSVFQKLHLNAVYVKMNVNPEELAEFMQQAIAIGIRGLSVTAPLKEKILPFVDHIEPRAKQIGAINTLLFKNGQIIGTNTDGPGALDAIEQKIPVRNKKIVLIGAGGPARGIAFEAKMRGARVLVLNRTVQKAKKIAADLECDAGGLDELPKDYDILINCSPDPMPIDPQKIKPHTWAMDIVYSPKDTIFLQEASMRHCHLIYGEEMFLNQAARQTAFWQAS